MSTPQNAQALKQFVGKFHRKTSVLESFFNKVQTFRPATLLKRDSNIAKYWVLNIVKVLKTAFFIEHVWWLLLNQYSNEVLLLLVLIHLFPIIYPWKQRTVQGFLMFLGGICVSRPLVPICIYRPGPSICIYRPPTLNSYLLALAGKSQRLHIMILFLFLQSNS